MKSRDYSYRHRPANYAGDATDGEDVAAAAAGGDGGGGVAADDAVVAADDGDDDDDFDFELDNL
jgi:hypothetical protein